MGEAKRCDRCRRLFSEEELIEDKEAWRYDVTKDCHPYDSVITFDLCLSCKRELMRWLEKLK